MNLLIRLICRLYNQRYVKILCTHNKKVFFLCDFSYPFFYSFAKEGFNKITIKNLLHHTSGIKFTDQKLNLVSDNAMFYWGDDLRTRMLDAIIQYPSDSIFKYSSENTLLLGYIIEKVTKGTISQYLEDKLWIPLGMEASGS